MKKLVRYHTFI